MDRSSTDLLLRRQVHYYQGLHDVASVLLMELGGSEAEAFPLMSRLVIGQLRDCTRARWARSQGGAYADGGVSHHPVPSHTWFRIP